MGSPKFFADQMGPKPCEVKQAALLQFADNLAAAGIDIDENDPAVANELEPIGLGYRIVFRPQILRPGHRWQNRLLDFAERLHIATAQIRPSLALFITRSTSQCWSSWQTQRESGEEEELLHDVMCSNPKGLNAK